MGLRCWRCGEPLRRDLPRTFPRLEQCKACGSDLHVCRMCRHYAPRYVSQCAHDTAEPPRDRELANFCQHFRPSPSAYRGGGTGEAEAARRELDSLFGAGEAGEETAGEETAQEASDALEALNALFEDPPEKQ
ncbi:MAG: hypothetical protein Kow006_33670 [Gammaproteobacteria bacterium]